MGDGGGGGGRGEAGDGHEYDLEGGICLFFSYALNEEGE